MRLNRLSSIGWVALLVLAAFPACSKKHAGPSTPERNKVLNLAGGAANYVVLDVKQLAGSGLVDLMKQNMQPQAKMELDQLTNEMGVDPFHAISLFAVWGQDFNQPDFMRIAIVTDIPGDKINKALDYLSGKEKADRGQANHTPDIAMLGDFDRSRFVEVWKKTEPTLKELGQENDIFFYQTDKVFAGIVDHKAVLAGKTKEAIQQFWAALSSASASASDLLDAETVMKLSGSDKKNGLSKIDGTVVSSSGDLGIDLTITSDNEGQARQVSGGLQGGKGFLLASKKDDKKVSDILNKLQIEQNGTQVHVTLKVPASMLK